MPTLSEEEILSSISRSDSDKAYNLRSMSNLITSSSRVDLGSILNEDFSAKFTLSMMWGLVDVAGRSLYNIQSIVSAVRTFSDDELRRDLLLQDESWQILANKSDDFTAFIELNGEFLARVINKNTELDPEHLERKVITEDIIPLVKDLITASGSDPIATGPLVGKIMKDFFVLGRDDEPFKIESLISNIFEAADKSSITATLSSEESLERISNIFLRVYDTQPELRETLKNSGLDEDSFKALMPVIKDFIKSGILVKENREVILSFIYAITDKDTAPTLEAKAELLQKIVSNTDLAKIFMERNIDPLSKMLGKFTKIRGEEALLDERDVSKEDLIPLIMEIMTSAKEDGLEVSKHLAKIMDVLKPSDGSEVDIPKFTNVVLASLENSKIADIFQKSENLEYFTNIISAMFENNPDLKASMEKIGFTKEKLESFKPFLKALVKSVIGNPENRSKIVKIVELFVAPGEIDSKVQITKLFEHLESMFENEQFREDVSSIPGGARSLAGVLLPILSEVDDVTLYVNADILKGSTDLGEALVDSFMRDTKNLARFSDIINADTEDRRAVAIIELFSDEQLKRAFIPEGDLSGPKSLNSETTKVVCDAIKNVINLEMRGQGKTEEEILEIQDTSSKFLEFGVPVVLEVLKNATNSGEKGKTDITSILSEITELDRYSAKIIEQDRILSMLPEDAKEARDLHSSEKSKAEKDKVSAISEMLDKSFGLALSDEQSSIISEFIPQIVQDNREKMEELIEPMIANNQHASFVSAKQTLDLLENPDAVKKLISIGRNANKKKWFAVTGQAISVFCTSKEVRSIVFSYLGSKIFGAKKRSASFAEREVARREVAADIPAPGVRV